MARILVTNLTDKDICVWDGHTPYHFGPKGEKDIPLGAYELAIKHNDYKDKICRSDEVDLPTETKEPEVPKQADDPDPDPWDDDEWDPNDASIEVLKAYASRHGLHISDDLPVEDAVEIIIEHHMTT